jgi:hypothetical protein
MIGTLQPVSVVLSCSQVFAQRVINTAFAENGRVRVQGCVASP